MIDEVIDTIAAATVECAMQSSLPNWLPAERHAELREFLYDLAVGALVAHKDARRGWIPEPSKN